MNLFQGSNKIKKLTVEYVFYFIVQLLSTHSSTELPGQCCAYSTIRAAIFSSHYHLAVGGEMSTLATVAACVETYSCLCLQAVQQLRIIVTEYV